MRVVCWTKLLNSPTHLWLSRLVCTFIRNLCGVWNQQLGEVFIHLFINFFFLAYYYKVCCERPKWIICAFQNKLLVEDILYLLLVAIERETTQRLLFLQALCSSALGCVWLHGVSPPVGVVIRVCCLTLSRLCRAAALFFLWCVLCLACDVASAVSPLHIGCPQLFSLHDDFRFPWQCHPLPVQQAPSECAPCLAHRWFIVNQPWAVAASTAAPITNYCASVNRWSSFACWLPDCLLLCCRISFSAYVSCNSKVL